MTLLTRGAILGRFPERVRRHSLSVLRRRGVKVVEHAEVTGIARDRVALAVGVELRYDLVLLATGTRPPSIFTDSGLPTRYYGGLLVNEYLQIPKYP